MKQNLTSNSGKSKEMNNIDFILRQNLIYLKTLSIITILVATISIGDLSAQCTGSFTIFTEDFEDNGNTVNGGSARYSSPFDFYDSASDDDYWGRVEGSTEAYYLTNVSTGLTANTVVPYSGWNGNFYYAGEDMDDVGASIGNPDGNDIKEILFTNINITDATNMCFSGLFASGENDPCGSSVYDDADYINLYYNIDGGGDVLAMCFNPDLECNIPMDISNEPLHHDPDCNGDGGEGTLLSAAFQEFTFNIPGTGNSLDLRIEIHMDAGSEEVALDYFRIRSDTATPIELLGFNAKQERETVSLAWATATEVNNDYFVIEHSLDGENFREIGNVDGAGTTTRQVNYTFEHVDAFFGKNYYRLKQIDFDGQFSYSDIEEVSFISQKDDNIRVSPNPFTDEISIQLSQPNETEIVVKILDISGRIIQSSNITRNQAQTRLLLSELDSGMYFLQIGEGASRSMHKITKL